MDFSKLMQEANKMQRQMQQAQKELEETLFEVESSGGAIKISIYGNYHVEKIDIDEDLVKEADKEMLEDMLLVAMNDALETVTEEANKIGEAMQSKMPNLGF